MSATALPRLNLRKWQEEALESWIPTMRGIIKVVTGGGKTIFAEACIREFILSVGDNARILIVVPTIPLLDQWLLSLVDDLKIKESEIALYSSKDSKPKKAKRFNIAVINSTRKWNLKNWSQVGMLVVDECHRAATGKNAEILKSNFRATLGLSATPERQYDLGFENSLIPALGPVIFEYSLSQALRDKVVCRFELTNIKFDPSEEEAKDLAKHNKIVAQALARANKGTITEDRLKLLLIERARFVASLQLRVPLTVRVLQTRQDQKAIVFHESIKQAQLILGLLEKSGFQATIYHSQMSASIRRDNLRLFKKGIFRVLVCCRSLDEGINVPDASLGIIASSSASSRQRIQRMGRVLRPSPGKDFATIVTLYATNSEKLRLEREAQSLEALTSIKWLNANVGGRK